MSFKATTNASGTRLTGNGMLNVIRGKHRIIEKIVKKNDSPVNGIEFILEIANGKGIAFEKWNNDIGRYSTDDSVKVYPLTVNIFIPETDEVGKSYMNLFANLEAAKLDTKLADGFACPTFVIDEIPKYTATLADDEYWVKGDFKKLPQALDSMCEDIEPIECTLEFPVAKVGGNNFGSKGESQADKVTARLAVVNALSTDGSEVQKGFITLSTLDPKVTALEYLTLILG